MSEARAGEEKVDADASPEGSTETIQAGSAKPVDDGPAADSVSLNAPTVLKNPRPETEEPSGQAGDPVSHDAPATLKNPLPATEDPAGPAQDSVSLNAPTMLKNPRPETEDPSGPAQDSVSLNAPTMIKDPRPETEDPAGPAQDSVSLNAETIRRDAPPAADDAASPAQDSVSLNAETIRRPGPEHVEQNEPREAARAAKRGAEARKASEIGGGDTSLIPMNEAPIEKLSSGAVPLIVAGLVFMIGVVVLTSSLREPEPSQIELEALYPYGVFGYDGPDGRYAPPAMDVAFTPRGKGKCSKHGVERECLIYEYKRGGFVGTMAIRYDGENWERVGDQGMPFRPNGWDQFQPEKTPSPGNMDRLVRDEEAAR